MSLKFGKAEYQHFDKYLQTLTAYDLNEPPTLSFQRIHDTEAKVRSIDFVPLAEAREYYEKTIVPANKKGYYTNCALSELVPDGDGNLFRRKPNLGRLRGQIVDVDDFRPWETIEELIKEFQPTLVVATSRDENELYKTHFYFLYDDSPQDFDYHKRHVALGYLFDDTLERVVSDVEAHSPLKAFRIPGTYHQKNPDNIFLTQVIYANPENYFSPTDSLFENLNIDAAWHRYEKEKQAKRKKSNSVTLGDEGNLISRYPGASAEEKNRNTTMYEFVFRRLFNEKRLTKNEALGAALYENQVANDPPLEEEEVIASVESAYRNWIESFDSRTVQKMAKTDSKSARELLQADMHATLAVEEESRGKAGWAEALRKKSGYDFSNRVRYTHLMSDTAILSRLAQKFVGRIICHTKLGIFVYDEATGIWEEGEEKVPEKCMEILSELPKDPTIYDYFKDDNGRFSKKTYDNFFKESYSVSRMRSFISGVRFIPELKFNVNELDANLYAICCKNGVIDLKTGELCEHSPDYRMTKSMEASYTDLPELCETERAWRKQSPWSKVVYEIMGGDVEMSMFLQRLLGYTMLGGNDRQILAFFYGTGSNGKSLVMETLSAVFGSYSAVLKAEFLMQDRNQSSPGKMDAFARIRGCRLVTSSELDNGQQWSESTIKDITGNDRISAKFMGKGIFEFLPQATFIVRGNSQPTVSGTDEGIWRRLLTVGFEQNFEKNGKKDDSLFHFFKLPEQLDSVLGWLVRGCLEYQRIGLAEPQKVIVWKNEYRNEMNPLKEFVEECLVASKTESVGFDEILRVYAAWSKHNDQGYLEKTELARKLHTYGIKKSVVSREEGRLIRKYPFAIAAAWQTEVEKNQRKVVDIRSVFRKG